MPQTTGAKARSQQCCGFKYEGYIGFSGGPDVRTDKQCRQASAATAADQQKLSRR
jgi:hypothetical protein